MAENKGESSASLPFAPLLVVLATVAGLATLLPSRSARPVAPSDETSTVAANAVSARLWQDPLSVAREAFAKEAQAHKPEASAERAGTGKGPCDSFQSVKKTYDTLARKGGAPVVLVVCEPNSPYAEDAERRVRDRSAIIHALAAENYLPESSTTLQYVKVPDVRSDAQPAADSSLSVLPYETFVPLDSDKRLLREKDRPVLILWLADGTLSNKGLLDQLAILAALLREGDPGQSGVTSGPRDSSAGILKACPANQAPAACGPPLLRVLGPTSSEQYRLMLTATDWDGSDYPLDNLAATKIYSCHASAPEEALAAGIDWVDNATAGKDPETKTEAVLNERVQTRAAGFKLVRTICPDDKLAAALWAELARRRVDSTAQIAAIAELDNFYGRASMLAFLHSRPGVGQTHPYLDLRRVSRASPNISIYTYMMGIDGALPKNALGAEEQKVADTDAAKSPVPSEEPSEGLSQIDYFRRLAEQLAQKDRHLKNHGSQLSAVAVLGSDIYDKLQILRTVRSRLPNALFLTDNLDARFGHPDEWAETRNLLVASSYDLVPRRPWHSQAPPFRDSSQAAVYAAARMAFAAPLDNERWRGEPFLFEIGRRGPVRLQVGKGATSWTSLSTAAALQQGPNNEPRRISICLVVAAGLILLLRSQTNLHDITLHPLPPTQSCLMRQRMDKILQAVLKTYERLPESALIIPLILGISLAITVWRYQLQDGSAREPFAFFDGISIWPGNFVRMCLLLLGLHLIVRTLLVLENNSASLQRRYPILKKGRLPSLNLSGFPRFDSHTHQKVRFWPDAAAREDWQNYRRWKRTLMHGRHWWRLVISAWSNFWPHTFDYTATANERVDVRKWWSRYRTWSDPWRRLGRATVLLVLYLTALLLFIGIVHEPLPDFPVRGTAFAFTWDIAWVGGVIGLFVTFLVVDATLLNTRAIRDLNRGRSDWHLTHPCWQDKTLHLSEHIAVLEPEDCADFLDIDFIARRSDAVNSLIYYPFILLSVLILGRWTVTDSYQWTPAFFIGLAANAGWTIYCAIRLPIAARNARRKSLARLRKKLLIRRVEEDRAAKATPPAGEEPKGKKSSVCALEQVIAEIENMNRGAFVGIWDQPILHAVLVPSSGAGIWALIGFLPH